MTQTSKVFCKTSEPRKPGDRLMKCWQRGFLNGTTLPEQETWADRATDYWALQSVKYGLLFDLPNVEVVLVQDPPHVRTFATVIGVMEGERVSEKQWRKRVPPFVATAQMENLP